MAGVDLEDLAVVAACLIAWGLFSRRLERWNITPPITFVVLGLLLANGVFALVSLELAGRPCAAWPSSPSRWCSSREPPV